MAYPGLPRTRCVTMNIVYYPDPALRRGGKPITEITPELRETAKSMLELMYAYKGVGLAAPQVGLELNLLVLNPSGDKQDDQEELVLINPKITARSGTDFAEEGCLSFPGIYADVERHMEIEVEYQDLGDEPRKLKSDDFLARIIQHELDHLTGVLFVDRLSSIEKLQVRGKLQELEKKFQARA